MGQECGAEPGRWRPRFPRRLYLPPSRRASPRLREPELREAGNEWRPKGWERGGTGPRPREGEEFSGGDPACPLTPGGRSQSVRGAPSRARLTERGGGRAEARAGPLGAPHLRDVMFLPPSGSATDPLLAQAPLGLVTSGWPEGGPLGTGRGAEPAGRAQTPLQAWGSRRLCSRPPSPVRSSFSPALPRRRHSDVTPRDAPCHFLLPGGGRPGGGW